MCELFSKQPLEGYQYKTRSIRLDGHVTSVKLEASFWQVLEEIATKQQMRLSHFLSNLYNEALDHAGDVTNFTSLLRCTCLIYLRQPNDVIDIVKQQLELQ